MFLHKLRKLPISVGGALYGNNVCAQVTQQGV